MSHVRTLAFTASIVPTSALLCNNRMLRAFAANKFCSVIIGQLDTLYLYFHSTGEQRANFLVTESV